MPATIRRTSLSTKFIQGLLVLPCLFAVLGHAAVNNDAANASQRWVAAKFLGVDEPLPPAKPYLKVQLKPDTLMRDSIHGWPLLIANQKYEHGLAMRSPGAISVEAPSGARSFQAVLGVDSNDFGHLSVVGRGSVVAIVESEGQELYRSPVLHEGMEGIPIHVDLQGTHEFTLRVTAVGERMVGSPSSDLDNADWANANVTLADGTKLSLSDLPVGTVARPYSLTPPFSFRYEDRASSELLKSWPVERSTRKIDQQRTEYTSIYQDPSTHLIVRCVAVAYRDFPTVEWTVYFKNGGSARTPILQDIQALDTSFEGEDQSSFVLHHTEGSSASDTDFRPIETSLPPRAQQRFASIGGRPTDGDMPYFNLAWRRRGVIFVIGWPGQWALQVSRDPSTLVRIRGGQELTHFWLAPGEEVRTPLAVVQFYEGDWIDGQNVWRQWMDAYNLPRVGGKLPSLFLSGDADRFNHLMQDATVPIEEEYIDKILKIGIPINHWWMDAGWYPIDETGWRHTGTWIPDPKRFPQGLRPLTDYIHERHLKAVLWFEPERVAKNSWLDQNHPEWLLGPIGPHQDKLLFLGNPDALHWLVDHVSELIQQQGIDVYRQDFNFPPLELWRAHDTEDRQGITEIEHVEGYLAYFDALLHRFPNLVINTCASGGRRADLETLRRALLLTRSDRAYEPISQQGQTFGLSLWLPFYGVMGTGSTDPYTIDPYLFRSQTAPAIRLGFTPETMSKNKQQFLRLIAQWREADSLYYGDFFPLTPYSLDTNAWIAWQFNQPKQGTGVIQAFRRQDSPFASAQLKLRGLDPAAHYAVKNFDTSQESEFTGSQLMNEGISVPIHTQPGAAVLLYRRNAQASAKATAEGPIP